MNQKEIEKQEDPTLTVTEDNDISKDKFNTSLPLGDFSKNIDSIHGDLEDFATNATSN